MTNSPVLASLARPNRSFTREDLRKKENRINLELFGAHGIPEFWEPLCKLLRIPQGAWLTREVVAGTSDRPDSILKGVGLTDGCVEVELGRPDEQQLGRYSKRYSPVIAGHPAACRRCCCYQSDPGDYHKRDRTRTPHRAPECRAQSVLASPWNQQACQEDNGSQKQEYKDDPGQ